MHTSLKFIAQPAVAKLTVMARQPERPMLEQLKLLEVVAPVDRSEVASSVAAVNLITTAGTMHITNNLSMFQ